MENKAGNQRRWYEKNAERHKANVRKRKLAQREANRAKTQAYLREHPCIECGETDLDMLTFDHVTGEKRREVSALVSEGYGWETIQIEIDKCVVRCWNHHMKRTAVMRREKWARRRRALEELKRA